MARPSTSNPSEASGSSVSTLTWNHTFETNKDTHLIVCGASNGWTSSTLTVDGVTIDPVGSRKDRFTGVAVTFHTDEVWIIQGIAAGVKEIIFTANAVSGSMAAGAFNVADGAPASVLLGITDIGFGFTPATLNAFGWDAEGLIIAFAWGQNNVPATSITPGTEILSVGGLCINQIDATNANSQAVTYTRGAGIQVCDCGAYMIPPLVQSVESGTFQVVFTGSMQLSSLPVDGIVFSGLPYGDAYVDGRIANIILGAGTWKSWQINTNLILGVDDSLEVEIYLGGGTESQQAQPTGKILTISGANQTAKADGLDFINWKYDRVSLRAKNVGDNTFPSNFCYRASFLRDCGNPDEQIYGGGNLNFGTGTEDQELDKATLFNSALNWGSSPLSQKSLVGIDGEFLERVSIYQTDTTLNHDFYYKRNNILQDGSGGSVDTESSLITSSPGQALARWVGSLPVLAADFIADTMAQRDASGFFLRVGSTSLFKPTSTGEMLISGHGVTSDPSYVSTFNSSGSQGVLEQDPTLANEDRLLMIIPPLTALGSPWKIKGMINDLDGTAPGTDKSVRQDLRINEVNSGIFLNLSGATTTGTVGGDIDLFEDDSISDLWTPTNSPNAARQFWAIPGESEAAVPETGSITVIKIASDPTTEFPFVASGDGTISPGTFSLQNGESQVFSGLTPGTYSIEETVPPGWTVSYEVSSGDPNTAIDVSTGATITVMVTNLQSGSAGFYEMIPGKTDDTIWVDVILGTTIDVKIP